MSRDVVLRQSYFDRGVEAIQRFEGEGNAAWLFYAALEFRMAIERYMFAWLVAMQVPISKSILKKYRASELRATVLGLEPLFIAKLRFARVMATTYGLATNLPIPDLDVLSRLYGQLSAYLHAIKDPKITVESAEWWKSLSSTLDAATQALRPLTTAPMAWPQLNEQGREAFDRFASGEVTEEELAQLLRAPQEGRQESDDEPS